jgi:hypothetical protein
VFKTTFNAMAASHREPHPNFANDVHYAADVADFAVNEWKRRFEVAVLDAEEKK